MFGQSTNQNHPAILRYLPNDFQVIKPGDYVLCAVSGKKIPLNVLRYWSVSRQEAYAGPEEVAKLTHL